MACGWRHSAAVDEGGGLWVWGWGRYGQLGCGDHADQLLPKQVEALAGVRIKTVAGGWRHTLALDDAGAVYGWGWNKFGQLGNGSNEDVCSPEAISGALGGERVVLVASGWRHSLVCTEGGAVYSWGRGVNGARRSLGNAVAGAAAAVGSRVNWRWPGRARDGHRLAAHLSLTPLSPPLPKPAGQLGRGDMQDANTPTLLPALSVGTLSAEALTKAAHPVVSYAIPAGERYAVVPDSNQDGDWEDGASVPDLAPKRQRV